VTVRLEAHTPSRWVDELRAMGHVVTREAAFSGPFGHAQVIDIRDGVLWGATDPRARAGAAAGW
jgi:gamma-glutamyltranspeptidase